MPFSLLMLHISDKLNFKNITKKTYWAIYSLLYLRKKNIYIIGFRLILHKSYKLKMSKVKCYIFFFNAKQCNCTYGL